jgi:hypothetical protein
VLDLPLPLFLPPGFIFIFSVLSLGSVFWDFKLSSSIVTVLPASQVTFVFYQPLSSTTAVLLNFSGCGCLLPLQVQFAAVLLNYSGCDCLLPIQVQLQLYFRTTQAQLCTTNSRATVYYLEFILFYLVISAIIWLQNILFLQLAYLIYDY